ncbi:MAG: hypothetical protein MR606_03190 [Mollicutes bacterium]|mgnify:CR=1 FL=1|nr:hypothetical protein [Mollicutes bacterium]MDD7264330.1 hypothetical protein [bacterium]MDY4979039.1 hypothetical protein [Candidatus Onthovivens sp.]
MSFSTVTKDFVNNYVLPFDSGLELKENNIKSIIDYISTKYEKPMSQKLGIGEPIDLDFFVLVNEVINDLCLHK